MERGQAASLHQPMFFRQIATTEASLSYFFGCAIVGKAVAVDVVTGDEERFIPKWQLRAAYNRCIVEPNARRKPQPSDTRRLRLALALSQT
jgi:hypothetical protein